jgi:hypothetical protein
MDEITDIGWRGANSSDERWRLLIGSYVLAVRNDLLGEKSSFEEAAPSGPGCHGRLAADHARRVARHCGRGQPVSALMVVFQS